jgi:hypothetical protein
MARLGRFEQSASPRDDLWWACSMTLVEIQTIWERFAEMRLVALVNRSPSHFLSENSIRGISCIPAGLAQVLVRGGARYFDFRSCSDLIDRADKLVPRHLNPFRAIALSVRDHLDAMAAIRNNIIHESNASFKAYRQKLREVFGLSYPPSPGEFLDSIDRRHASPLRGSKRIRVFSHFVTEVTTHV